MHCPNCITAQHIHLCYECELLYGRAKYNLLPILMNLCLKSVLCWIKLWTITSNEAAGPYWCISVLGCWVLQSYLVAWGNPHWRCCWAHCWGECSHKVHKCGTFWTEKCKKWRKMKPWFMDNASWQCNRSRGELVSGWSAWCFGHFK